VLRSELSCAPCSVAFLSKPNTFDTLEIVDEVEEGFHKYSFRGAPKPWPANSFESHVETYFIKRGLKMFVLEDHELATTLTKLRLR
jgi:hypothetical protein